MTDDAPATEDERQLGGGSRSSRETPGALVIDAAAIDPPSTEDAEVATPASAAPRRRRRWLRIALACALLGFAYYGVNLIQVWRTGEGDQARPVDAIIVMGAAQYNGRPSPQLRARLDHVVELWNEGLAPLVIVTGGKLTGDRFTESEASAAYLTEHGVDPAAILQENAGHSSWQSLSTVAGILRAHGAHRVLLVSDPYHSLRIRLMAEELGFTAYVSPTRTSPIRGATVFGKEMKEAAGVAVGRIIGFGRLLSLTG